jgi:hypothetical protein
MKHLSVFAMTLGAMLGSWVPNGAAQDLSEAGDSENRDAYTVNFAFAKDGLTLRELRTVGGEFWRLRVISRDASTGKIHHMFDLGPDIQFLSATTDGRIAAISENRDHDGKPVRFYLLDTETGRAQDVPANWFDPEDHLSYATISGDGRLVSIYSDSGPADAPRVVSVYNWRTKKLVARQAMGFSAGGVDGGGVTEDGKIAFQNNRTGTEIVDAKTGRSLLAYGSNSVRSPDGAWVVELAGYLHAYERPDTNVIDGSNGKSLGKLDLKISEQLAVSWLGTFCGTSGRFVAWDLGGVLAFDLRSRKQIASFLPETWLDKNLQAGSNPRLPVVGCSSAGKRVVIRSGARLTLHDLD